MTARAVTLAAGVVVVLAVSACAQDTNDTPEGSATTSSSSSASSTTTSPSLTTTSSAPASTSASSSPPSTSAGAAAYPESQQDYTSEFVRAWGAGDRARAARYATQAAVDKVFDAIDPGGPSWSLVGCDNAGPRPACTFSDPGQGQRLVLFYDSAKLAQPRAIVDAEFIPDDPSAPTQ